MGFAPDPTVGAHDAPPHVQTPIGWRGPVTRTPIRPATRRLWRLNLAGVCRLPPPIQINYGYTTGRCMVPEIYLFYKSCFLGPTCLCQGYWCRLPDIRGERQWNLISIPSHSHWATRNSHSHWFQILLPFSSRSNRRPLPIPIKNVWFTFIQTIRREGIAE